MKKKIGRLFFLFLFCFCLAFGEFTLRAEVDRKEAAINDTLTYSLIIESDDRINVPSLGLSDFGDFSVLGTSSSTRMSIVNGKYNRVIELKYTLSPKRIGELVIPAVSLKFKGKSYNSDPIKVKITNATSHTGSSGKLKTQNIPDIFVETNTNKKTYYLGEPIIYSLHFFNRLNLFNQPQLRAPEISGLREASDIEKKNKSFQRKVGAKMFSVSEVDSVYFATKSGKATFGPTGIVYSFSFFEPQKEVRSNSLEINIKPIPANSKFQYGVGDFKIESSLDRNKVKLNEGVYLTVKITGIGNLRDAVLPDFGFSSDLEAFDPKIVLTEHLTSEGLKSEKVFEFLVIPRSSGSIKLPGLTWTYFNPHLHKFFTKQTKSKILSVSKSASGSKHMVNLGTVQTQVEVDKTDIRYIKTNLGKSFLIKDRLFEVGVVVVGMIIIFLGMFWRYIIGFFRKISVNNADQSFKKHYNNAVKNKENFYDHLYNGFNAYIAKKCRIKIGEVNRKSFEKYLSSIEDIERMLKEYSYFEDRKFSPGQPGEADVYSADLKRAAAFHKDLGRMLGRKKRR